MSTRPVLDDFVGFESQPFAHDSHETSALYLFLYLLLVVGAIIVGQLLEVRWEAAKNFLPEAALMILVGLAVGGVVAACGGYATSSSTSTTPSAADDAFDTGFKASYLGFNSSVFFFAFLPPIIYSSGYHLKRRLFFVQIVPILSLAVLGTSISILATSLGLHLLMPYLSPASALSAIECVCFASLISSTDPVSTLAVFQALKVDPNLFYIVFGESVLNDAVAITVFRVTSMFVGYSMGLRDVVVCVINFAVVFSLSCLGGYLVGILAALLFRLVDFSEKKLAAVAIFVSVVYTPFFLAETLQLSGIVTCLFAGISSRRYVNKNLCPDARRLASFLFQLLAYLGDTSCFCLLGMSVFSQSYAAFRGDLVGATLVLILAARAAHVYPLLHAVNGLRAWRHRRRVAAWTAAAAKAAAAPARPGASGKGSDRDDRPSVYVYTAPTADTLSEPFSAGALAAETDTESAREQPGEGEGDGDGVPSAGAQATTLSVVGDVEEKPSVQAAVPAPRPSPPLVEANVMHMVWFAGLRGAVAFACANIFPDAAGHRALVVGTTTVVVLCTVFVFGTLTTSMIGWLGIKANVDATAFIKELDAEAGGAARLAAHSVDFERRYVYPWVLRGGGRGYTATAAHGVNGAKGGAHGAHAPPPRNGQRRSVPAAAAPPAVDVPGTGATVSTVAMGAIGAMGARPAARLYSPLHGGADSPSPGAPPPPPGAPLSGGRLWGIAEEGSDPRAAAPGDPPGEGRPSPAAPRRPWGLFVGSGREGLLAGVGPVAGAPSPRPHHLQHSGRRFSFGSDGGAGGGAGAGGLDTPSSGGGSRVGPGASPVAPTAPEPSPPPGPGPGPGSVAASPRLRAGFFDAVWRRSRLDGGLLPVAASPSRASSAGGDVEVDEGEELDGEEEGSDDCSGIGSGMGMGMGSDHSAALPAVDVGACVRGDGGGYVSEVEDTGSADHGSRDGDDGDGDSEDYYSVSTGSLDGHDARSSRRRALTERNLLSYLAHALAQPHTTRAPDDLHLLSPTLTSTRVWDFGRSGEDSDDDERHDNE